MERNETPRRNMMLRVAGLIGVGVALYHGVAGGSIVRAIPMAAADLAFVAATYQIGTMGWLAMGVLLFGAAGFDAPKARSWVVWTAAVLYGLPAFGTFALTGGEPSVGGICLAICVALALYGRRPDTLPLEPATAELRA